MGRVNGGSLKTVPTCEQFLAGGKEEVSSGGGNGPYLKLCSICVAYMNRLSHLQLFLPDFASWKESGIPSSVKHLGYRKNSNWNNFTYREIF